MTQTASAYQRLDLEKYFSPRWTVEALLSVERFSKVWDCAGGAGDILAALPQGMQAWASDIAPDAPHVAERDFFDCTDADGFDILSNPPYGKGSRLAVRFIEHALELTRPLGGKVAMLLRVDFDSAKTRRHLFADHPAFAAKYVLTQRIRWVNLPQKAAGPTENHAWLVWDWRKRPGTPPVLGYLPQPALEATSVA